MARAAAAAGTIMCLSTLATATLGRDRRDRREALVPALRPARRRASPPSWSRGAREHGFEALVLTVDTPVLGRRERDLRDRASRSRTSSALDGAPARTA